MERGWFLDNPLGATLGTFRARFAGKKRAKIRRGSSRQGRLIRVQGFGN